MYGKSQGKRSLRRLSLSLEDNTKMGFERLNWLMIRPMARFCEHGNEQLGSITAADFLTNYRLFKKDPTTWS
jgi:hypothetical protein